ncbi:MAG: succinate dehydrogenase iron-sulfur subunit, partial [Anaerolineales bacterium]
MSGTNGATTATVIIQRFNPELNGEPILSEFQIEPTPGMTILDALLKIKAEQDGSLTFRRSCRHGICGSCAANVNGSNILVCKTPLKDELDESGRMLIRPLPYIPVIKDLVVDRSSFWEQYLRIKPWLIPPAELPEKELRVSQEEVTSLNHAETCIMCGACYSACPVINTDKGFLGPHAMLKGFMRVLDSRDSAEAEHMAEAATVWDCTTCYTCNLQCPKDLDPGKSALTLRSRLVEEGKVPRTLGVALTSTFRNQNPFEMVHAERMSWAEGLELQDALQEQADALYFVCCLACYDPRAQKLAQAMVKVMETAGVNLSSLGSQEACCGSEMRRLGEEGLFEMMAEERSQLLAAAKAGQVVTASPHCFDVFRNHYPDFDLSTEHYSQYVARLIAEG